MAWLSGTPWLVAIAAVKTVLLVLAALVGLRLGQPRMLSRLAPFDVVTFGAMGAAIGRSATASTTSFAEGAAVVVNLVLVHRLLGTLRSVPLARRLVERPAEVVIRDGMMELDALRRTGLSVDDLDAVLRGQGVMDIGVVSMAAVEPTGAVTVGPRGDRSTRAPREM